MFSFQGPVDWVGPEKRRAARVVVDEIRVVGSRCGRFAPALALLARGAVDVTPLVSEVMPLADGARAMERAGTKGILKVLLETAR